MTAEMANNKEQNEKKYLEDLENERNSLGDPFNIAVKLLEKEIELVKSGKKSGEKSGDPEEKKSKPDHPHLDVSTEKHQKIVEKVAVPYKKYPKYNFVGKLLGPKGATLKQLQEETMTRMSILGRGSIRDKTREDELRKEGGKYAHLNDDLHVNIEAFAEPSEAHSRIAHALAELRKFLVPTDEELYGSSGGGYEHDSYSQAAPPARGASYDDGGFRNGGEAGGRGGHADRSRGRGRGGLLGTQPGRGSGRPESSSRGHEGGAPRGRGGPPRGGRGSRGGTGQDRAPPASRGSYEEGYAQSSYDSYGGDNGGSGGSYGESGGYQSGGGYGMSSTPEQGGDYGYQETSYSKQDTSYETPSGGSDWNDDSSYGTKTYGGGRGGSASYGAPRSSGTPAARGRDSFRGREEPAESGWGGRGGVSGRGGMKATPTRGGGDSRSHPYQRSGGNTY